MDTHSTYKGNGRDFQTPAHISVSNVSDEKVSRLMEEKYGWMRDAGKELLEMMKAMKPNEKDKRLRR